MDPYLQKCRFRYQKVVKKWFRFYKLIKELILIIYNTFLGDIVYRWWMGPIPPSEILPLRKIGDFYIGWQKFLSYRRNFFFPISRIKIQKYYSFIIFSYMTRIMEIFYGGGPSPPTSITCIDYLSIWLDMWHLCCRHVRIWLLGRKMAEIGHCRICAGGV